MDTLKILERRETHNAATLLAIHSVVHLLFLRDYLIL